MSQEQPQLFIPPEAEWGPTFDVGRATDAYIATIPAADREKSDDYYEGGYWIEAWGTLITVGLCVLLLRLRHGRAPRRHGQGQTGTSRHGRPDGSVALNRQAQLRLRDAAKTRRYSRPRMAG